MSSEQFLGILCATEQSVRVGLIVAPLVLCAAGAAWSAPAEGSGGSTPKAAGQQVRPATGSPGGGMIHDVWAGKPCKSRYIHPLDRGPNCEFGMDEEEEHTLCSREAILRFVGRLHQYSNPHDKVNMFSICLAFRRDKNAAPLRLKAIGKELGAEIDYIRDFLAGLLGSNYVVEALPRSVVHVPPSRRNPKHAKPPKGFYAPRRDPYDFIKTIRTRTGHRYKVVLGKIPATGFMEPEQYQANLDAVVEGRCPQVCAHFLKYGLFSAREKAALLRLLDEPGLMNLVKGVFNGRRPLPRPPATSIFHRDGPPLGMSEVTPWEMELEVRAIRFRALFRKISHFGRALLREVFQLVVFWGVRGL